MKAKIENFDLLQLVHDTHRKEINYHRDVMYRVFQWTSSLLMAIGGGLLFGGNELLSSHGLSGRIFVTVSIFVLFFFSFILIKRCVDSINVNAKIVVKADKLLHLFDKEYFDEDESFYPVHWRRWGTEKDAEHYQKYNIILIAILSVTIGIIVWTI